MTNTRYSAVPSAAMTTPEPFWNTRRRIFVVLLFFMTLFSFAAASTGFWMHYTIFTAVFFVLFVCDLMFLSETSFLYDPDLKSWAQKSGVASADY